MLNPYHVLIRTRTYVLNHRYCDVGSDLQMSTYHAFTCWELGEKNYIKNFRKKHILNILLFIRTKNIYLLSYQVAFQDSSHTIQRIPHLIADIS